MTLIKRDCPLCFSPEHDEVVILHQADFTLSNPSYQLDHLAELGLDAKLEYPIVKCRKCKMIYSLYSLDDEAQSIVYNQVIDSDRSLKKVMTVSKRIKDHKRWIDLLSLLDDKEQVRLKVLDYGCGWGAKLLAAQGPGVQVVGFDITEWKVAWARNQGLQICTSVEELMPYAPFDMLISTSVLEHLESPRKAVKEMASLLKPGGHALLTCIIPDAVQESDWKQIQSRLLHGQGIPKEINPWEHLNYFTIDTLSGFLREFGFIPAFPSKAGNNLKPSNGRKAPRNFNWLSISKLMDGLRSFRKRKVPLIPEYWFYPG
jgi:SAM-dependent methyltransferase